MTRACRIDDMTFQWHVLGIEAGVSALGRDLDACELALSSDSDTMYCPVELAMAWRARGVIKYCDVDCEYDAPSIEALYSLARI